MAEEQLSLLEKIRQVPWIKETREKHQKALKNYREKKFNEPAVLEEEYVKKIDFLQGRDAVRTDRLLQIFNKDTTIVKKYIDSIIEGNPIDLTDSDLIKKYAHPDDFGKWSDWNYLGDGRYDLLYRKDSKDGKEANRKVKESFIGQIQIGPATGLHNAYQGTAELIAVLGDLTGLTDDALGKLEKVLPAIDLEEVYREGEGGWAKFTGLLVQYGFGYGVATTIAKKILNQGAKKNLIKKGITKARDFKLKGFNVGNHGVDIAKYGGYYILPAAIADMAVSGQANVTIGDIFAKEDGNWIQKKLVNERTESLEGLTGKARAAAILRNKLKFGKEGTAILGGLTLSGKALKTLAFGSGKIFSYGVEPLVTTPIKMLTFDVAKQPFAITNPWSRLKKIDPKTGLRTKPVAEVVKIGGVEFKMPMFEWQKKLATRTKTQNLEGATKNIARLKNVAKDLTSLPGWFRVMNQSLKKALTKTGVPKFELWKFSDFASSGGITSWRGFGRAFEAVYSRFMSNFKFDKPSAEAIRSIENKVRTAGKLVDGHMRNLDRLMYKMVDASFASMAFKTSTSVRALSKWADVLQFMRTAGKPGTRQYDDALRLLPKELRFDAQAIRRIIDQQSADLLPLIKDSSSGLTKTIIDNMGKYLHTSYEIFRNTNYRPKKIDFDNAVRFFIREKMKLIPKFKNIKGKDTLDNAFEKLGKVEQDRLISMATQDVNQILKVGITEGSTAIKRLQSVGQAANLPGSIFKNIKNVPDEVASLLGKVNDPKSIILDTVMEQAHTLHAYNAYKDLTKYGLGKWLFRNVDEYQKWAADRGIRAPRAIEPVDLKSNYNVDLGNIFRNADGSPMYALPEMAKAITDTNVLMDVFLKIPFFKSALAVKATVQMNKTVLSVMTQMRNITTAAAFALSNGHMGTGASVADNFEMLFKEMLGKTQDPKALRELLEEAMEAGALDSSTIARELEALIPEIMGGTSKSLDVGEIGKGVLKKGFDFSDKTSDQVFKWMFTNQGAAGKVVQKAIEAYQLGDNIWKLFGYQFTKSQLKPAFRSLDDVKKYFDEVEGYKWNPLKAGSTEAGTGGRNLKTLDDAIKEVAGIQVRQMYPNYSMVPRVVENIRKIPIMGNFVGFTSEMWRNSFQILLRGNKELMSSNPYIRQMGARRLLGFSTTALTLGPTLYSTALYMTGMDGRMIEDWKKRFAPEFMKYHTIIPTSWDEKLKIWYAYDFDTMYPYADIQTPFKVFSGVVAEGPNADQNMLNVYANALAKSIYKSVEPFVSPSIAWQTFLDIKPDKNGISKNRYGSTIIDWNNDENPWLKAMTYVYDKALPTTLQNIENIVKAFNGQVTKHSVEMDPLLEVSKTMTGVSIFKVDPIANFKFKIGNAMGGVAQANKRFKSLAINAETLRQDKNLLLAGYTSEHVPKLFEKNQQNTYREWSKAYEDIQAMRNLNYTEQQIKDALTHRGSFSKDDVKRLMLGVFVSNSVPKFDEGTFKVIVDEFNRKNNTGFSVSDFLNKKQLKEIENTWNGIPLGLNEADRLEGLKLPKDLRILFYQKKLAEQIEKKQLEVEQDIERKQELIKKKQEQKEKRQNNEGVILPYFGKAPSIKPNVPIRTAAVSEEVVKTAALPGNINENTGLTRIEEALLSNEEKAMRLRQKGRTA
tara:strand:- start:33 stop:4988 length:4956 start_codon:yes stop_codon:yes gene_type:complete